MNKQNGQVILILILVMTVALAIGISVIQRSLSDVSTATTGEQSSRAFSAAEAGIEKKLSGTSGDVAFTEIGATATVSGGDNLVPCVPGSSGCEQLTATRQVPLEYPPMSKEEVVHTWLADPNSVTNPPVQFYAQNSLDVYWGNSTADKAALELTLVYYDTTLSQYKVRKWYLDNPAAARNPANPANNFNYSGTVPPACTGFSVGANTYQCKYTIGGTNGGILDPDGVLPVGLMLLRARLLYNTTSQPFAVQAVGTCPTAPCDAYSLPPQAKILMSTGTAGNTQRKVQLFQEIKVVPPYFDYGIFSVGTINK